MDPKLSLSGWLWLALASALAAMAVFAFGLSKTSFQRAFRASSRPSAARCLAHQHFRPVRGKRSV